MDRDTVIALAREAGIEVDWSFDFQMRLERFAALIAAHEQKAKPITNAEMSAWVKDTWEKCQAEAWQEPVAYFDPQEKGFYWAKPTVIKTPMTVSIEPLPLYSAPTPRKPLHDMAVFDLADEHLYEGGKNYGVLAFARAIERAHGIGEQK